MKIKVILVWLVIFSIIGGYIMYSRNKDKKKKETYQKDIAKKKELEQ